MILNYEFRFELIVLSLIILSGTSFSQELHCRVTDTDNRPLEGVEIRSFRAMKDWTQTSADGFFVLQIVPAKALIIKVGYAPMIHEFDGTNKSTSVKLKKSTDDDQVVLNSCGDPNALVKKFSALTVVGDYLWLPLMKNERVRQGSDVDYQDYSIAFSNLQKTEYMHGIWGPNATSGLPFNDWLDEAKNIKMRSIVFNGEVVGDDWRGESNNGKSWRYTRVFWEAVRYETSNRSAASFFDGILNRACFNEEESIWKRRNLSKKNQ